MYYISKRKTDFIRENFFEQSFVNREPDLKKFKQLTTSKQLHYLADIYNWDDGVETLNWVIDSPLCDFGTAVMIFWRSEPSYYTRYSTIAEAGHDREGLSLLLKIIDNYHHGKYRQSKIKYDPIADSMDVNEIDPKAKWTIPDEFKRSTTGRRIITKEYLDAFLFFVKRYFKEIKRQRNRNRQRKNKNRM